MGRREEEGRMRHQDGLHGEKRGSRQFFGRIKRNLIGDFSFFNDKNQKTKTKKNEKKDIVWPFHPDEEYTLERILPDTCVLTDMEAQDYESAVNEMVLYLHRRGYVENMEMCINDIRLRERIESTVNAEKGLAFPHARTTQATRLISVVGLCNGKCEDSKLQSKTMIIVLTLGPKDITYPYMQYIAHAASALMAHPDLDGLRCIDDSRILRDVIVKR